MKKIFGTAMVLTVSAILAAVPVYADGLVFDPETYNSTVDVSHPYAGQPAAQKTANSTAKTTSSVVVTSNQNAQTQQNNNLQNALFELDSAQVEKPTSRRKSKICRSR